MYFVVVLSLTLVLPLASAGVEFAIRPDAPLAPLACKWFTFWAVGVRLGSAGVKQMRQPAYTAHTILGLKGDEPLPVVRELGFANFAKGVLGLCSLASPTWATAGALAGGIFYGLAGVGHAFRPHRNAKENTAMVADLVAAAVLLGTCAASLLAA